MILKELQNDWDVNLVQTQVLEVFNSSFGKK